MSNTLLTIDWITRKAVQLFVNSNAFLQTISREYNPEFRMSNKIGSTLRVRLPIDPVTGVGQTVSAQSLTETSTTITLATQANVTLGFTSADLALKADDFTDRYLLPSMNKLAGQVATDIMTGAITGDGGLANSVPNLVQNVDGSGNTLSPTQATFFAAGAKLDQWSCPRDGKRKAILDPVTQYRVAASTIGLFNPQAVIGSIFRVGAMNGQGQVWGIDDWRMDQTTLLHSTANYGTLPNISGGSQTGSTITLSGTPTLNVGDIINLPGCNMLNFVTKQDTGQPMSFVVTAVGSSNVSVYPAVVPAAFTNGVNTVQYANVTASPTNGSAVTSPLPASEQIRKNMVYHPTAFTFVTADLPLYPGEGVVGSRAVYDGVSLRILKGVTILNDTEISRADILYGYKSIRPEWAVIVADMV